MRYILHFIIAIFVLVSFCEAGKGRRSSSSYDDYSRGHEEQHHESFSMFGDFQQHSRRTRAVQGCMDGCKNEALRIPPEYNFFDIPFPPKEGNRIPPINVTFKARVEKIRDIDEVKEEITLDMDITLGWIDWKILAYRQNASVQTLQEFIQQGKHLEKPTGLITINNPEYLKTIWKPNLYVYDLIEKTQPKLMSDLITLRYDPNGGFIFYQTRTILKLSCPMEFQYYPADTQTCSFLIRGFSYNENLLNLMWYKAPFLADRDQSNFDVQLSEYEFKKLDLRGEIFNGLSFNLKLRRKLSYHLVQTYIPSAFFIVITWLCFLIPSSMVEARIGISMTTLLTLTAMFASVRETSPVSSYVKALDLWMVSCIFSVFLTLLEFTILTWLRHLKNEKDEKSSKAADAARKRSTSTDNIEMSPIARSKAELISDENEEDKFEFYTRIIEKCAFAVFFVLFVVFNALYWSWLFGSSEYYEWSLPNTTFNSR